MKRKSSSKNDAYVLQVMHAARADAEYRLMPVALFLLCKAGGQIKKLAKESEAMLQSIATSLLYRASIESARAGRFKA